MPDEQNAVTDPNSDYWLTARVDAEDMVLIQQDGAMVLFPRASLRAFIELLEALTAD